ncbi:hypothetical protein HNY73_005485 [Argiope bruennichi]|uniref:Uncharacterized protein n=1 Tax=Argiope bruennichi TaxID=94029 RepID=A0A8T0FGN8_ARGBR|nr:hypothetical protein HNY73_005485 [Argiope bruennichi]
MQEHLPRSRIRSSQSIESIVVIYCDGRHFLPKDGKNIKKHIMEYFVRSRVQPTIKSRGEKCERGKKEKGKVKSFLAISSDHEATPRSRDIVSHVKKLLRDQQIRKKYVVLGTCKFYRYYNPKLFFIVLPLNKSHQKTVTQTKFHGPKNKSTHSNLKDEKN